jgi:hypothetical protein
VSTTSPLQVAPAALETIDDVLARMQAIDASLEPGDGVACFNHLYRTVTEAIQRAVDGGELASGAFVARLAVEFAKFYFAALDEQTAGAAPPAWRPLFEARSSPDVAPVQFAIAGMNAHINRDLPIAVVITCEALGLAPDGETPQHADYQRVNDVLARVELELRASYFTLLAGERTFAHAEDALAMWSVRAARDVAWDNARALWQLRGNATLERDYVAMLDRAFEIAGRALLFL